MNTENALAEIEKRYSSLSHAQQKAADYILKNPLSASYCTVEHMAQATGVSTATIVRLALALGYNGYTDFQAAFQAGIQFDMAPSKRLESIGGKLNNENELESEIIGSLLNTFHETINNLNLQDIRSLVRLIAERENVYIVGSRSCYSVAHYLAYNINRVNGNCRFLNPSDCCFAEELNRIKKDDLLIAYTLPRYINDVIVATQLSHEAGAFVAVLTDSYRAPSTKYCDMFIRVPYKSIDFHNTVMPGMIISELIVSLLTSYVQGDAKRNLSKMEDTLSKLNVHMK